MLFICCFYPPASEKLLALNWPNCKYIAMNGSKLAQSVRMRLAFVF